MNLTKLQEGISEFLFRLDRIAAETVFGKTGHEDYDALIHRVRKIDHAAAQYLMHEAPQLPDDAEFEYKGTVGECFLWCATPQGTDYWGNISIQDSK